MVRQTRQQRRNPSNATKSEGASAPIRTCVGCRSRHPQTTMLRVVLDPDGTTVRVDYLAKLPGRGAYLCATPQCVDQAVKRGGLKRAFRRPVTATAEGLMNDAYLASRRQLGALLSLATRAGQTAAGNSRVETRLRRGEGVLLLLASDASQGVQHKFSQWAQRVGLSVLNALTKAELGVASGLPEASMIVVIDPGFAQKIEQEVHRAGQLVPAGDSDTLPS